MSPVVPKFAGLSQSRSSKIAFAWAILSFERVESNGVESISRTKRWLDRFVTVYPVRLLNPFEAMGPQCPFVLGGLQMAREPLKV
jgi:hypothetical protein